LISAAWMAGSFVFIKIPSMETNYYKRNLDETVWLRALLTDYSIIALAFLLAAKGGWVFYPVSVFLIGIAQHRIAILAHEGAHGLISQNKRLNHWLAQIGGFWPLMIDMKAYKTFHNEHHRHTGDERMDPEFELKDGRYHIPLTRAQLYTRFALDMAGRSAGEFVQVVRYFAKRGNPVWALSFLLLSGTVTFYAGHPEFFFLFLVAMPTSYWAVFRLRIYGEHTDTLDTHRVHLKVWQRLLFAPHNIWMHWEHHEHPNVPYYQLPAVRNVYKDLPVVDYDTLIFSGPLQIPPDSKFAPGELTAPVQTTRRVA
jgi:fatty acid desaturase